MSEIVSKCFGGFFILLQIQQWRKWPFGFTIPSLQPNKFEFEFESGILLKTERCILPLQWIMQQQTFVPYFYFLLRLFIYFLDKASTCDKIQGDKCQKEAEQTQLGAS